MFKEIKKNSNWVKIEKINKGWSDDVKYYIETEKKEKLLLRVAKIELYEEKKKEFEVVCQFYKTGIPMSKPIEFGKCRNGEELYTLLTWVDGVDLEQVLPNLPMKEQYHLGRSAGEILRKIHSIQVPENEIPMKDNKKKKEDKLQKYVESNLRIDEDEKAVEYVQKNLYKICSKPPVYQHGDFHPGNLILTSDHRIEVIDFNRWDIGDPYEEFYKLELFASDFSIPYCVGQIDAYFQEHIPEEFWEVFAVYSAHGALYSIKWAEKFGQQEIDNMIRICRKILGHYDNFTKIIPNWYEEYKRNKG